jgi:hypothetical protein
MESYVDRFFLNQINPYADQWYNLIEENEIILNCYN